MTKQPISRDGLIKNLNNGVLLINGFTGSYSEKNKLIDLV